MKSLEDECPNGARPSVESHESLRAEVELLRERVRDAEETLDAIRNGDVDAVVVAGADSTPRVYTLETADQTYRMLVEKMQEGALTLTGSGDILYCNKALAALVEADPQRVIGATLERFVAPVDWGGVLKMIRSESKGEVAITTGRGRVVPTHAPFSALRADVWAATIYSAASLRT